VAPARRFRTSARGLVAGQTRSFRRSLVLVTANCSLGLRRRVSRRILLPRYRKTCAGQKNYADCTSPRIPGCAQSLQALIHHFHPAPKIKAQQRTDTVIIPDEGVQCQFPLGQFRLRKCSGYEDGSILPLRAALPHQEDYVLAALQARLDFGKLFFAVHRLLIDFQNDVSAA